VSNGEWYEIAQGPAILQGDMLFNCPVLLGTEQLRWPIPPDARVDAHVKVFDLVVMTQSCDLQNDKAQEVLVAHLVAWPDAVRAEAQKGNEAAKSSKFRTLLVDGNLPSLSLLHKREGSPQLPWSVVNFHRLFTLSRGFVKQFAASCGPRLRIRSPYREHLAQAFARYFMRVGLPHDARAFEKEGDVKA
jgi:hypothetical protein